MPMTHARLLLLVVLTLAVMDSTAQDAQSRCLERTRGSGSDSVMFSEAGQATVPPDLLRGKKVVQVGESSHGIAEFSAVKAQLFIELSQKHGYEWLAVEGPLAACAYAAHILAEGKAAEDAVKICMFPPMRSPDIVAAFQKLGAPAGARLSRLYGFDVQTGDVVAAGRFFDLFEPSWAKGMSAADQDALRKAIGEALALLGRRAASWSEADVERAVGTARFLESRGAAAEQSSVGGIDLVYALAVSALADDLVIQGLVKQGDFRNASSRRSRGMQKNVRALVNSLSQGEKIVVWLHNSHSQYRRSSTAVGAGDGVVGQELKKLLADDVFTLNLFAFEGKGRANNGAPYDVPPPAGGSVEEICAGTGQRFSLLSVRDVEAGRTYCWAASPLKTLEWANRYVTLVPSEQFDAALCVQHPTPSKLLP